MKIQDNTSLRGFLTVSKVYEDGLSEVVFEEKENLIVDAAKQAQLVYLYDDTAPIYAINSFQIGDDGTTDAEGLYPRVPTGAETSLYASPVLLDSTNVTYSTPASDTVVFSFDVLTSEANGQLISEVGLFRSNGSIFNIKTFAAIPKNSTFSLHFEWTIRYA